MSDKRVYRPQFALKLIIRLEDFENQLGTVGLPQELAPFPEQLTIAKSNLARLQDQYALAIAGGDVGQANTILGQVNGAVRQVVRLSTQVSDSRAIPPTTLGDPFSIEILTAPLDCTVELNTYRSLDTMSATIPFRDAPLESLDVRASIVEVYAGTVTDEAFSTTGRWKLPLDRKDLIFRGFVDTWDTEHSGDDATVKITARSLESMLVDTKVDPRSSVFRVKKGGEKISAYVNRVLAQLPATAGRTGGDQLKAFYFRAENEPTLDASKLNRFLQTSKSVNKAAGTPEGQVTVEADNPGGTDPASEIGQGEPRLPPGIADGEMTAWDLITQACWYADGCVPMYDASYVLDPPPDDGNTNLGDFILIRPIATIFDDVDSSLKRVGGAPDGFDRKLPDLKSQIRRLVPSDVRMLVWGRNVGSFRTSRKFGRLKVPTVEVVGYNPDAEPSKRDVVERYPKQMQRATRVGAKGDGKSEEVVRRRIPTIRNRSVLQQIAKNLYEALGRHELEVTVTTDDLASYVDPIDPTNPNSNPDILKLRHGVPVRVTVARRVVDPAKKNITVSPLSEIFERRPEEIKQAFMEQQQRFRPDIDLSTSQALVEEFVRRIVRTKESVRRTDVFYVKTMKHNWSADDGWSGTIELMNYRDINLAENLSLESQKVAAKQKQKRSPPKKTAQVAIAGQKSVTSEVPRPQIIEFTDDEGSTITGGGA